MTKRNFRFDGKNMIPWISIGCTIIVLIFAVLIYIKVNKENYGLSNCTIYPCADKDSIQCSIATEANKFGFDSNNAQKLMSASIYCPEIVLGLLKNAKPNTNINPCNYSIQLGNSPAPCNSNNKSFIGCSGGVLPYTSTDTQYPSCPF